MVGSLSQHRAGSSHNCLYCYARARAFRLTPKKGKCTFNWAKEKLAPNRLFKPKGVVMFPTTHDITPFYLPEAINVLDKILYRMRFVHHSGRVLIVTKAHYECVQEICRVFGGKGRWDYRKQILWRFTIGTLNENLAAFWEPGAPTIEERFKSLKFAYHAGFATSVSMEPMLAGCADAFTTFHTLKDYVTDKIWIGKMNKVLERVIRTSEEVREACLLVRHQQCNPEIRRLYHLLSHEPKVAWKDSIKEVIGL